MSRQSKVTKEKQTQIVAYAKEHGVRAAAKHYPGVSTAQIYDFRQRLGASPAKVIASIPEGVAAFTFTNDVVPSSRAQVGPSELELRTLKTLQAMPPPANGRPYSFLIPMSEGKPESLTSKLRGLIKTNFTDTEAVCFKFSIAKDNDKNVLGLRIFRTC